jgi:hypothetical protein
VDRKDLSKLQPMREALQQLQLEGLTGVHLMRTFSVTRSSLYDGKRPRCGYLGASCPYSPSSEELRAAEVNSQIYKVLDLGSNLNSGAGPTPLQEGVVSARVSMLSPVSAAYAILSFHCTRGLA